MLKSDFDGKIYLLIISNTVLPNIFLSVLTLMCISKNVNNIVYPSKICHVKDSAAQCDISRSWVHIKCNKLISLTTNISKAQMSPGAVFLFCSIFFHLEHQQIRTSSSHPFHNKFSLSTRYQEWWKFAFTKTSFWLGSPV